MGNFPPCSSPLAPPHFRFEPFHPLAQESLKLPHAPLDFQNPFQRFFVLPIHCAALSGDFFNAFYSNKSVKKDASACFTMNCALVSVPRPACGKEKNLYRSPFRAVVRPRAAAAPPPGH